MTTEWIDVNLPWKRHVDIDLPEYPNDFVDQKVRERFGFTKEELRVTFEEKWGRHHTDIEWEFRVKLESQDDLSEDDVDRMMDESDDPRMVACREIRAQKKFINEFVDAMPEVILWNQECDKVREQEKEEEAKACFVYSPLNRPGVLVEVQDTTEGTPIRRYLIGDINHIAGVCDDCTAFEDDATVLRAITLINEEDLKVAKDGT
jgi:hypothetical protein